MGVFRVISKIDEYYAKMDESWIGVDLDGTLAIYNGQTHEIGEPVPAMLFRVRKWLADGKKVKIMTARVGKSPGKRSMGGTASYIKEQHILIDSWCMEHFDQTLEITCEKDFRMSALWDDRAIQVIENTGERADGKL